MMDMKIPIPNFEDKGSVLNTLNFSLVRFDIKNAEIILLLLTN